MIKQKLLELSFIQKRLLQVAADVVLIWVALWLAFTVRVGVDKSFTYSVDNWWLFIVAPVISIAIFIPLGMYRAVIRYLSNSSLIVIARAVTGSALVLTLLLYFIDNHTTNIPRSFVFIYWIFSLVFIGGIRLAIRHYFSGNLLEASQKLFSLSQVKSNLPKVIIYGAGSSGNQLLTALRMGKSMEPVAFIDDDTNLIRRSIGGLRVYSIDDLDKLIKKTQATQLLLAMPSASRARRKEILAQLAPYPLHVRTVPGFMDLASGRVKVQDIQEVDLADLLGRDEVAPNPDLFERCIKDKVVMVTGAGGSIGSELCRQILDSGVTSLILYEHSEFNLYSIQAELENRIKEGALRVNLFPILGSIRNFRRMQEVMKLWKVDTVYHAAAYKHVPMVEKNVVEGVLNNTFGTLNAAQAAITSGVENFVLISTDKAVRPTNVMGSTKRLAEIVLQALAQETELELFGRDAGKSFTNKTRFTMVRFGNVLGSSGSVIPLFSKQIAEGEAVTVTHPNITRYFMTIPEAAQLVIQAGSMGRGGDVFVLDMGEPVKIVDLAEKMILLTGLTVRNEENPDGDIEIQFTGLRPGEKLYEELLIGDNVSATDHPKIMRANECFIEWGELVKKLDLLFIAAQNQECLEIRQLLKDLVDGYVPEVGVVDLVHECNSQKESY